MLSLNFPTFTDGLHSAKRLIAAWRVLVGVWAPARWEFSIAAIAQYATPIAPEANPWLDKYKNLAPAESKPLEPKEETDIPPVLPPLPVLPSLPDMLRPHEDEPAASVSKSGKKPKRRPPSRRIMRHVLRARVKAIRALAQLFAELAKQDRHLKARGEGKKRVYASEHLARRSGGVVDLPIGGEGEEVKREGWRDLEEVVAFLEARGAKIPTVGSSPSRKQEEEDWASLSSDGEGGYVTASDNEEVVWVPPGE